MNLKNTNLFSKKLIGFLLASLIFPTFILAQETEGVLLTGVFADSSNTQEQEILSQGAAKTLNLQPVWTYDGTDIITGTLGALAQYYNIPTPINGLEDPLFSQISGYQKVVVAHSAAAGTAVTLAKRGDLWGEELYIASTVFTSQDVLRQIRDLTSQGKGFNKIVLYTGDDMIPNFKELLINFKDYTIKAKITENLEVSLTKLVYEDRGRVVNILVEFLKDYAARAKAQFGKELVSVTIYGDVPGNEIAIKWEGQADIEKFNLQNDCLTGEEFQNEDGIFNIPLYAGFPHGLAQLELLAKFQDKYKRMPGNEDLQLFKQIIIENQSKSEAVATQARDPNELLVSPEGDVRPGDTLTYTIHYENEGEGIAFGVYFTDTLDEDLDDSTLNIGLVIDVKTGQKVGEPGTYNPETRTITWFVGEVGSRQGGSTTFSVKVKDTTPDGSEVINYATVYFPSVPEVTRTNGIVNRVTTTVDNTAPVTTISISPLPNQAGWNNTNVDITLTAIDNQDGSGVKEIHYKLRGAEVRENIISDSTAQIAISSEGITNLTYWSVDNAGNIESQKSLEIKLDKTSPTITATVLPQPNSFGWNNTDVTISFTAIDNLSGVATVTQPTTVTTEGANQHIGGEARDFADNVSTAYVTINIDKTPPQLSITATPNILWPPNHKLIDVTIGGGATDNLSGIAQTTFKVTDEYGLVEPSIPGFGSIIQLESWRNGSDVDGRTYIISATTKDKADNESSAFSIVICPHDQRKK